MEDQEEVTEKRVRSFRFSQEIIRRGNIWRSTVEDVIDDNEQKELKILCFQWNLEIIQNKGFKPKFTIFLMFFLIVLSHGIIILNYGYGSNFGLINFLPIIFGQFQMSIALMYELGIQHDKITKTQKILIIFSKLFAGILETFSMVYSLIFNTPFNSPVIFLAAVSVTLIPTSWMIFLTNDFLLPKFLQPKKNNVENIQKYYKQQIISKKVSFSSSSQNNHQKNNFFQLKNEKKNIDEWQIYKNRFWVGFVAGMMCITVSANIFYGYQLILLREKSRTLFFQGISLIFFCFGDFILVNIVAIFPAWVSHSAHTIAFVTEIPNFVLIGMSMWKLYNEHFFGDDFNKDNNFQFQLGIFSIVTTSITCIIHVVYIMDKWAVQNAIHLIQEQ